MNITVNKEDFHNQALNTLVHYGNLGYAMSLERTWWDDFNFFSKRNLFLCVTSGNWDKLNRICSQLRLHENETIEVLEDEYKLVYELRSREDILGDF